MGVSNHQLKPRAQCRVRTLFTPSVLLVNETLDEREMYARTLRAEGHRVITAEDSAVAYRIATMRPPDIVVTDVRSTGSFSGLELTRRLRSDERTSAVGIVVLTTCRGLMTRTLPSWQEQIRFSKSQWRALCSNPRSCGSSKVRPAVFESGPCA